MTPQPQNNVVMFPSYLLHTVYPFIGKEEEDVLHLMGRIV